MEQNCAIAIIQKQYEQPTEYLSTIALQNHLYGCFILMEDIAQGNLLYDGEYIKSVNHNKTSESYRLSLDRDFAQIGIRYGFIFDTKLILEDCLPAYKSMWLSIFKTLSVSKKIEEVDAIEDAIIAWIQKTIVAEDAFFMNALETSNLSQVWLGKALGFLLEDSPSVTPSSTTLLRALSEKPKAMPAVTNAVTPATIPAVKNAVTTAVKNAVTPTVTNAVTPTVTNAVTTTVTNAVTTTVHKQRQFERTRRNTSHVPILKKHFAHTRRSMNKANPIIHL
jgi:hypothetical protein